MRVEPIISVGSNMQSFTQWISGLTSVDPALWLAAGAGLVVILGFVLFGRAKTVEWTNCFAVGLA